MQGYLFYESALYCQNPRKSIFGHLNNSLYELTITDRFLTGMMKYEVMVISQFTHSVGRSFSVNSALTSSVLTLMVLV